MPLRPGQRLALRFGLLNCLLKLNVFALLTQYVGGLFVNHLCPRGEDGHERSIGAESVKAGPRLGRGSSPRRLDQADGHTQLLLQIAREEVGDGGEVGGGFRSARGPSFGFDIFQRIVCRLVLHQEQANLGILCRRDFRLCVDQAGHGELHVRLARCDPDVTDKNVVEHDCVRRLDAQLEGTAGFAGRKIDAPAAVIVGGSRFRLAAECDRDSLVRCSHSPDVHWQAALHDHVIGQQGRHGDVCVN